MQSIIMPHLEHNVGPRLEQEINELYLSIWFKRRGEYDVQFWLTRLDAVKFRKE
ncbi:hypothetical protein [Acinetobacter baumannii]|uniref:hypothetical protein n=1 Tax=Acinetobacter baumannii TaxID=470 RepID=UPI001C71DF15|nr:hypothetical protein [Acinetobacter baumannii]